MTSMDPASPISRLYDDLLWAIFRHNTDMSQREVENKTPALHTLMSTSHVSSKWRNLVLSLPSLWAAVVNLDILQDEEWRNEILKRASDSPLSVVGHKEGTGDSNTERLVSFLEGHWDKIRYLDVRFGYINWRAFEDRIWQILARPASNLEVFRFFPPLDRFNMDRKPLYVSRPSHFVLFNDQAPILHTFHAPGITPNLKAPWASHVRDLSLNGPLPVSELLSALSRMQGLEVLRDNCDAITAAADDLILPHVALPSLKVLEIGTYKNIGPYADLMTHLSPSPNCSVSFVVVADDGFIFDSDALSAADRILQTYSTYNSISSAQAISLSFHGHTFDVQVFLPSSKSFIFHLALGAVLDVPDNYTQILIKTLASLPLHGVEKLSLSIGETAGISTLDPELNEFVSSFSFARRLEITTESIQFLLNLPDEIQDIAFPAVNTVQVSCSNEVDVLCVEAFLVSRIAVGLPVSELHIRVPEFGIGLDMSCLEEFFGLKIVLLFQGFQREYICGSGHTEELLI